MGTTTTTTTTDEPVAPVAASARRRARRWSGSRRTRRYRSVAPGPPAPPGPVAPHRRLTRRRDGRFVAGVATGLADHLALPVLWVRVGFVLLTVFSGAGALVYGALWVLLPLVDGPQRADAGPRRRRVDLVQIAVLSAVGALGLLLLQGVGLDAAPLLPLLAACAGMALLWRQADDRQRARWRATATRAPQRRWPALVGAVLLAVGLVGFLQSRGELRAARDGLLSTVVVLGGLVLLALPWVVRTLGELRGERLARIRSQERAELAAQVHDSVLQTLALIQRSADDPREVGRLARSSERELRRWLYRPAPVAQSFRGALEQAAGEVEEAHGVPVEVVVVGDAPRDERLSALVSAAREALVNAAKHAQAPLVQVYAEVEPHQVTVFVRDRGRGFDPGQVPADRFGLRESVAGRVERAGGEARVRSARGEGTEVRLQVPRG